jgi:hypothetical protein
MPAVTRELKITYGSYVVGGSTDKLIDGYVNVTKDFVAASIEFSFVITAASEAAFKTAIDAAELAFRTPFQNLTVEQGAVTLLDLSHSTDTGFNSEPKILKRQDNLNTGRSRKYTVEITFGMPADTGVPEEGIRNSSTNVAYLPSRKRQVTISGVATAISGTASRAKYEAIIDAFAASILTALGGSYELGEEPSTDNDYADKEINFSRVYDEIIYSEAGSASDSAIVRMIFKITRGRIAPGDHPNSGAQRLVALDGNFDCWIDKSVTQDLGSKWTSIRNWIYQEMDSAFPGGALAITEVTPEFDYTDNRITAKVTGIKSTGSNLITKTRTEDTNVQTGVVLVPAWNGNPLSKYRYQGPATSVRTVTISKRVLGDASAEGQTNAASALSSSALSFSQNFINPVGQGGGSASSPTQPGLGSLNFSQNLPITQSGGAAAGVEEVLVQSRTNITPLVLGMDGRTFKVSDMMTVETWHQYVPLPATSSGGY